MFNKRTNRISRLHLIFLKEQKHSKYKKIKSKAETFHMNQMLFDSHFKEYNELNDISHFIAFCDGCDDFVKIMSVQCCVL